MDSAELYLRNLDTNYDFLSITSKVNYLYLLSIIAYEKDNIPQSITYFKEAQELIYEEEIEYDYDSENIFNIFNNNYIKTVNSIKEKINSLNYDNSLL